MASGRARLPPTPTTTVSTSIIRHHIDVQNNTLPITATAPTTSVNTMTYNNNNISNDDTFNALGPDLAITTSQVLETLSDQERQIILNVLSRDENVRKREATRIMLLRAELNNLRKRSALLKAGGSLDRQRIDSSRCCARCQTELGRIINRGAPCRACRLRVCKGCREFTNRSTDNWVCVVCHKNIELQSGSGEWMSECAQAPPARRSSITKEYIPASEIINKSIRRSWTISNPEDDNSPNGGRNGPEQIHSNLGHTLNPSSYPNLNRPYQKSPYGSQNMDLNESEGFERTPPSQRRILRQSTLPNPDPSYSSNSNLKLPVSPKQQISPQYSPYHTDNENENESEMQPSPMRYPIRRQSTLPCKPNEHHQSRYLSTSPNRNTGVYSRSPEKPEEHSHRYPPFVRQSTFPSNTNGDQFHGQRQLPTSPNRVSFNKSPDSGGESTTEQVSPRRFLRQNTLPNPDQHMKLLPTSPPKKSPQFMKRSPEFTRQNTLPNPDAMNTLTVHQHGPKFLPISPRQKQSFLFPQPAPAPRPFLSQQHFPTMNENDPTQPTALPHRDHSKMIKVRSHSNEEYTATRPYAPNEGRRMLPEIPTNRSPRLVRQSHVTSEIASGQADKRSPVLKTFAEAKQNLPEMYSSDYEIGPPAGYDMQNSYNNEYNNLNSAFAEADENNYLEENYDSYGADQPKQLTNFEYESMQISQPQLVQPDSIATDYGVVMKDRNRRRQSRELPTEPEITIISKEEEPKRKPEAMRSVSEDSAPKAPKIVTRRSMSHPEKESVSRQLEKAAAKIPSPMPLTEISERQKKLSPRRKAKTVDCEAIRKTDDDDDDDDEKVDPITKRPQYRFQKVLAKRGDSKSFDAVVKQVIQNEKGPDEKSQSMDDNLFSDQNEHKTTLNEAEIQSAVEAAAVIFKKVVLQKRKEKKASDDGEMSRRRNAEEITETENSLAKLFGPADGDDYKLVFISSDSSGKEEENDDSSSTTSSVHTKCSVVLDECDWDYFEPGIINTKSFLRELTSSSHTFSPFGSPNVYRKKFQGSPLSSPIFYRRGLSESPLSLRRFRESDTGTDEELLNLESSSPTNSSDSFLNQDYLKHLSRPQRHLNQENNNSNKNKKCQTGCTCGGVSIIPIPIPVAIPVPIATFQNWNTTANSLNESTENNNGNNNLNLRAIQQKQVDLLKLWNNASCTGLLIKQQQQQQHNINQQYDVDANSKCNEIGGQSSSSSTLLLLNQAKIVGKKEQQQQQQQVEMKKNGIDEGSDENKNNGNETIKSIETEKLFSTDLAVDASILSENFVKNIASFMELNLELELDLGTIGGGQTNVNYSSDNKNVLNCNSDTHLNVNLNLKETIKTNQHEEKKQKQDTADSVGESTTTTHSQKQQQHKNNLIKRKNSPTSLVSTTINVTSTSCSKTGGKIFNRNNRNTMITVGKIKSDSSDSKGGYLVSENVFSSSDSDSNDEDNEETNKSVQRSYDVAGAAQIEDIVISDIGNSDAESQMSQSSSNREDPSSSGSDNTDTDDTGTVADRRPKTKRFTKVFVVNKNNGGSSDSDSCSSDNLVDSSSENEEDSSDNDTDTERDCGIKLNYMKPLEQNENDDDNSDENEIENENRSGSVEFVAAGPSDQSLTFSEMPDEPLTMVDGNESSADSVVLNSIKYISDEFCDNDINENPQIEKHLAVEPISENNMASINIKSTVDIENNDIDKIKKQTNDHSYITTNINNKIENENGNANSEVLPTVDSMTENLSLDLVLNSPKTVIFNNSSENFILVSEQQQNICDDDKIAIKNTLSIDTKIIDKNVVEKNNDNNENVDIENKVNVDENNGKALEKQSETTTEMINCNVVVDEEQHTHTINFTDDDDDDDIDDDSLTNIDDSLMFDSIVENNEKTLEKQSTGKNTTSFENQRSTSADHSVINNNNNNNSNNVVKFTSLVMITQDNNPVNLSNKKIAHVSVVASDTTRIFNDDSVVVQHRNWQPRQQSEEQSVKSRIGFFEENFINRNMNKNNINVIKNQPNPIAKISCNNLNNEKEEEEENFEEISNSISESALSVVNDDVQVITGAKTLSAVVCLEDGLADDDSWVEEISQGEEEEFATTTATESDIDSSDEMSISNMDREEELRGYNRASIDFTLHTIVEESCEESEVESMTIERRKQQNRVSASELEKYFFFGLGNGNNSNATANANDDSVSESSSICSEGLDSLNGPTESPKSDSADLASSRLEKYFLTGFLGFSSERNESDGSGSVGSDSEGHPSPEQRRKKLVRARGSGRSHNSSLDNLLTKEESEQQENLNETVDSSETDTCDETMIHVEKNDSSSFDTAKRKKKTKKSEHDDSKKVHDGKENSEPSDEDEEGRKTPQPEFFLPSSNNLVQSRKQHSRDSGFIGSNDDLLKSDGNKSPDMKIELEEIQEENKIELKDNEIVSEKLTVPPSTNLTRKDSFNNWSSDEETNLMMSKMRQFFKTLIAASANAQNKANSSRNSTPVVSETNTPKTGTPVPKPRNRNKPPQLVYFENELTRLMKTVPGIRDEQVREIVEYLSSEDTWSDSYDSSDYTSSDLEGNVKQTNRAEIQQQISNSCQEIIDKFETVGDEEGDRGDGGLIDDPQLKETAFVYQKLVASITKMTTGEEKPVDIKNSPPIIAKVMHHIGSRLVALMHEVSSGESMKSNSPKPTARYHRRLQAKISATTTEDDDSTSDSNLDKNDDNPLNLSRSKSHDLLLSDSKPHYHQSNDTVGEEKEASDYERFSWRGSFESALLANGDSRNKLSMLESSSSALSVLAAKRRSAGDLLFSSKSMSREQLDRVRSCGSIGGGDHDLESSKLWESTQSQESKTSLHRSGILEDDTDESSDNDHLRTRSTLPRSLQTTTAASTNSLPRLPTTTLQSSGPMQKAQSVYHFFQNNVKSARYRAPGFNRIQAAPKRAASAPGLQQPLYAPRRADRRNKIHNLTMEETNLSDAATNSPVIGSRNNATPAVAATMHPVVSPQAMVTNHPPTPASATSDWPSQSDEDIDRLVAMHQNRHNSLSSLGVRSDSMASVYSGAGEGRYGTVTVKGMVEFGMQYNYKQGALEIHVKQCKDLAAVNKNRSDPYVKVYLLPDKSKTGKRKTKVKKHTLNPVFDEVLRFYISVSALESRTLWLTIWHSDMFGRNDFLGEVMISLQNKVFDNPQPQWYQLQERSEPFEDVTTYRGDIIVGLKFIPAESSQPHSHGLSLRKFSMKSNSSSSSANNNGTTTTPTNTTTMRHSKGSLHILVKEAKHLSPVKASGLCDAFCKSYLLPDKNRSSKQKTPVAKRTTNPTWNYTFVYEDVTLADLSERALELTIWDHDRLASNEFLGGVRFSLGTGKYYGRIAEWNDASGKELSLWQNMLNRPNFWVEGCLSLRSSLDAKTTS